MGASPRRRSSPPRRAGRSRVHGRRTAAPRGQPAARRAARRWRARRRSARPAAPATTTPYDARAASRDTLPHSTSRATSSYGRSQRVAPPAAAGGADPDRLAGPHGLGVGERVDHALARPAGVDGDLERSARLAAADAPAGQDRPVGDRHEVRVLEHPDVLLVAQPAPVPTRAAAVDREAQTLDHEGEPRLRELARQVAGVGHHVDGVLAVGVGAAAGAAAEDLAHQVGVAGQVGAVDAGVADRLLVGRHVAVDRLGHHPGEHAEQPQDHEGPGVGGRREDRGQQRAGRREAHLDQRHHALVDVELGHPLGGVGEVAQDRRQPLLEEVAVGVVAAVVDRTLRLRRGAVEVQDEPLAAGVVGRRAGQGDPLRVQPGLVDAVVLGVVLPDVLPHRDLGEDLAAERLRGLVEHRVEAGFDGARAVALEQLGHPAGAHQAGRALGVQVGGQRLRHPAVARHDPQRRVVGDALVPQPDRRHHQPLLEDRRGARGHRAGHRAADVVVVAEGLHERDDPRPVAVVVEHRRGHAQVRQVADAALGEVDVVVEEHVAGPHRVQREVARHRVHQRGVGPAGELAQVPVVDAGAVVVRVADHRRARRPPDRGLDLHLDRGEVALDDLDQHRVDLVGRYVGEAVRRAHALLRITRLP